MKPPVAGKVAAKVITAAYPDRMAAANKFQASLGVAAGR